MKRFLSALLGVVMVVVASSCGGNSQLKELVEEINRLCPMSAGVVGDVTGARLEGKNVVVSMSIDEEYFDIDGLQDNDALLKSSILQMFNSQSDDFKSMLDILKKNNGSFTYEYVGKRSGKKVTVDVTNEELRNFGNEESDPQRVLDDQIALTNIHFPLRVDEITVVDSLTREGKDIVYWYRVDEEQVKISQLEDLREAIESNLYETLRMQRDDISTKVFLRSCYNANADIVYRYQGSISGESTDFRFSIKDVFED